MRNGMGAFSTSPDDLATASEVARLLASAESRDAAGRTAPSASSDLRRATRLLSRLLAAQGVHRDGRRFMKQRALSPEAAARLDTAVEAFLVHPLHYNCVPACCDASAIRFSQICTAAHAIHFIGIRRPKLLLRFSPRHVQSWLVPSSTRIAPAAAAAFAQSPEGTTQHWRPLSDALLVHSRWQVRDFLLRAIARASWPSPPRALVDAVKRANRGGDPRILREVWQQRALRSLGAVAPAVRPRLL